VLELSIDELDLSKYLQPTDYDEEVDDDAAAAAAVANHEALAAAVERVQHAAQEYCDHAVQCQALSLWLGFCIWRNDVKYMKQQEEDFALSVRANSATVAAETQAAQMAQLVHHTADERDSLLIRVQILEAELKEKEEAEDAYKARLLTLPPHGMLLHDPLSILCLAPFEPLYTARTS